MEPGRSGSAREANSIFQYHPSFAAPRYGPHSLRPESEGAISGLFTGFFAYRPTRTTELIVDPEMALGGGLSQALGVAGFPNLDVVRNPTLSHAPYIARAEIHQIIPLSPRVGAQRGSRARSRRSPLVPQHRLELRFGKMSTADIFDINPAGSDSHLQFMNWTVDNNGAYDYAADTRGYTYGLVVEYQGPRIEARLGEMLMPKVANGIDLDFDFTRSRADNLELEIKYSVAVRLARDAAPARLPEPRQHGQLPGGDRRGRHGRASTARRHRCTAQHGPGQARLRRQHHPGARRRRARLRRAAAGATGDLESFAYTEVENTIEIGGDITGVYWRRPTGPDRARLRQQRHLRRRIAITCSSAASGFLLGDGYLTLRARNHRRALLQRARLARPVVCRGHPAHRQPGLQRRSRSGLGLLVARTSGILGRFFCPLRASCAASLHLKKCTRIGGDSAAIGWPVASRAGSKRVARAHSRAAAPKPNPGSVTTSTSSALPSARTRARRITVCSSTCWASASAGQGQFQAAWSSETGRARLRMRQRRCAGSPVRRVAERRPLAGPRAGRRAAGVGSARPDDEGRAGEVDRLRGSGGELSGLGGGGPGGRARTRVACAARGAAVCGVSCGESAGGDRRRHVDARARAAIAS